MNAGGQNQFAGVVQACTLVQQQRFSTK